MGFYAGLLAIALVIFTVLDVAWLAGPGRGFYQSEIGHLLLEKFNIAAAAAFYVLFLAGLTVFVIVPAARANAVSQALLYGAFFGLVTYGAYDLTNLATLKGFTVKIAMIDMAWGAFLCASVSGGTVLAARLFRLI